MNLQLDHFSDVIQTLKSRGVCARACPLTHNILLHFAARPRVEHGSHNVSRWMTWLSISLKNAAACDKWYQLQNHSITESLNANGAWEKPFVGHPRACRTQCRTNKKSPHLGSPSPGVQAVLAFEIKSPGSGEAPPEGARPFGLVFAVWLCLSRRTQASS